jgi:prepilin-type N-terminal cleavage/methylation domain-containing protein
MPHTTTPRSPEANAAARRAFSLIELLVVIAIIGLIISIVLPAVFSARKSARNAETLSMCNALSQACSQFILDQRRAPGYFSQRDMGAQENLSRGFSQMENAMLDLAGGIVTAGEDGDLNNVGPVASRTVTVRPSRIGAAGGKAYFTPKAKYLRVQNGSEPDGGNRNSDGGHRGLPVLVDAEGMPILMWTVDDRARKEMQLGPGESVNDVIRRDFAKLQLSPEDSQPARFYWAANAAFLSGDAAVGRRRINQTATSVLGEDVADEYRPLNLAALLGNPNTPVPFAADAQAEDIMPSAPRGSVIIHSSGIDQSFAGRSERGAKRRADGILYYGDTFVPGPRVDLASGFDDILMPVN